MSWINFINQIEEIFLVIGSIVLILYGLKIFKIIVTLYGSLLGLIIGIFISAWLNTTSNHPGGETAGTIAICLITVVLFGYFAYMLYKFLVYLMVGLTTGLLFLILAAYMKISLIAGFAIGFAFGFLMALWLLEYMIIISMALLGIHLYLPIKFLPLQTILHNFPTSFFDNLYLNLFGTLIYIITAILVSIFYQKIMKPKITPEDPEWNFMNSFRRFTKLIIYTGFAAYLSPFIITFFTGSINSGVGEQIFLNSPLYSYLLILIGYPYFKLIFIKKKQIYFFSRNFYLYFLMIIFPIAGYMLSLIVFHYIMLNFGGYGNFYYTHFDFFNSPEIISILNLLYILVVWPYLITKTFNYIQFGFHKNQIEYETLLNAEKIENI